MSIKIKLAQLSLLLTLLVGAVTALPVMGSTLLAADSTGIFAMGDCNGGGSCTT
jgi:hypothetical protein